MEERPQIFGKKKKDKLRAEWGKADQCCYLTKTGTEKKNLLSRRGGQRGGVVGEKGACCVPQNARLQENAKKTCCRFCVKGREKEGRAKKCVQKIGRHIGQAKIFEEGHSGLSMLIGARKQSGTRFEQSWSISGRLRRENSRAKEIRTTIGGGRTP